MERFDESTGSVEGHTDSTRSFQVLEMAAQRVVVGDEFRKAKVLNVEYRTQCRLREANKVRRAKPV